MKGWIVAIVVVALVVLIVVNRANDNSEKNKAEAVHRAELRAVVQEMANKWQANQDWESTLAGPDGNRISEIMSAELQRLWSGQTILFVGTLEDMLRLPDGSYQVTATHDGLISSRTFIMSRFGVRVACPEEVGNSILAAHAKEEFAVYSSLAVVAQINNIIQEQVPGEDGISSLTRTGVGECIDALYLGPERIWENQ